MSTTASLIFSPEQIAAFHAWGEATLPGRFFTDEGELEGDSGERRPTCDVVLEPVRSLAAGGTVASIEPSADGFAVQDHQAWTAPTLSQTFPEALAAVRAVMVRQGWLRAETGTPAGAA